MRIRRLVESSRPVIEKLVNLVLTADSDSRTGLLFRAWIALSILALWFFFWWSIGMWPSKTFGEGFARVEQVSSIQVLLLEQNLLELRTRHCQALQAGSQSAQFFLNTLREKEREYHELTGQMYPRPDCSDVLIPT